MEEAKVEFDRANTARARSEALVREKEESAAVLRGVINAQLVAENIAQQLERRVERGCLVQATAGSTFAVGATTCTISYGTWALWCDYLPNQPGADSHLRWDQLTQSSETDTLPAQQRMGHIVTGSNARTYAQSLAQLDTGSAINLSASAFLYKVGGKDPFDTDGYLNSALVWSEALRRFNRGVQRQQVGLRRDAVDQIYHLADTHHGFGKLVDRLAGLLRIAHGANRHLVRSVGLSGDLPNRRRQLFRGRRHRGHIDVRLVGKPHHFA